MVGKEGFFHFFLFFLDKTFGFRGFRPASGFFLFVHLVCSLVTHACRRELASNDKGFPLPQGTSTYICADNGKGGVRVHCRCTVGSIGYRLYTVRLT